MKTTKIFLSNISLNYPYNEKCFRPEA